MMDVLADCEGRLRDTASRKILLEVTLLKMIEARHAVGIDAILRQLQQLRAEAGGAPPRPAASKTQAAAGSQPAPVRPAPPAAIVASALRADSVASAVSADSQRSPSAGTGEPEQVWTRLLEAVGRASPFARSYFNEAHPVSFTKTLLTIGFDPEFAEHIALVDNAKNHTLLQTKLTELGFPNMQVKFVQASAPPNRPAEPPPAPASPPASPPAPASAPAPVAAAAAGPARQNPPPVSAGKDDFANDPLIQKALEVFKGQIVDMR
jgi:DNA polymerase III gamma/tau subunit